MHFNDIFAISAITLGAAAATTAGCSSTSTGATAPTAPDAAAAGPGDDASAASVAQESSPAIAGFWTALHAGDWASSATVIAQLQAETVANPSDSVRAEYLGLATTWRLAEAGRDPSGQGAIEMTEGPLAGQYLQAAYMLDHTNLFSEGFLGITTVDEGIITKTPSLLTQGFGLIEQAAATSPMFSGFTHAFATHMLPSTDPNVAAGLAALWTGFDYCVGTTLDRQNPDYTPYLGQPDPKRFCADSDEAPHGLEGVFLYMGDLLVEVGQIPQATVFYKNAQKVPGYATWAHAPAVQARLASDLEARSQAYKSADPTQWPAQGDGVYACTQCHAITTL
jgi:hypothetical protein